MGVWDCPYCGVDRDPCHGEDAMRRRAEGGDAVCAKALADAGRIGIADCRPEIAAAAVEMERMARAGRGAEVERILASLAEA
jgi:hypothetical protein